MKSVFRPALYLYIALIVAFGFHRVLSYSILSHESQIATLPYSVVFKNLGVGFLSDIWVSGLALALWGVLFVVCNLVTFFSFKEKISLWLVVVIGAVLTLLTALHHGYVEFYGYQMVPHHLRYMPWIDGRRHGQVLNTQRNMAKKLEYLINQSQKSLHFAIYGVHKQDWFIDSLKGALDRNLNIQGVVDQKSGACCPWNPEYFTYKDTAEKLYPALGAQRLQVDVNPQGRALYSIMHNKFFVFDKKQVWLGSTNISSTGIGDEYNANLSFVIQDQRVAEIFVQEFEQMFRKKKFSRFKKRLTLEQRSFTYKDGTQLSVYFSPQNHPLENAVRPFIRRAKKTLDIAMFFLTDEPTIQEIIHAHRRGVKVRIINDAVAAANRRSSSHELLWRNQVSLRIENWGGKMHMKTAVVDGKDTILGSMNWSRSGDDQNDESTLLIENNPSLAHDVTSYFDQLWKTLHVSPGEPNGPTSENYPFPYAESTLSINSCTDGINNDFSGGTDADDRGCRL